jgi:hypothetical protein
MKYPTYTLPRMFAGYKITIAMKSCFIRSYCSARSIPFALLLTECGFPDSFSALHNFICNTISKHVTIIAASIFVFRGLLHELIQLAYSRLINISFVGCLELETLDLSQLAQYFVDVDTFDVYSS